MNNNLRRHYAFALSAAAACALVLLPFLSAGGGASFARQNPAAVPTQTPPPAMFGPDASGLLKLTVTVTDKAGRFVTGLGRESFAVSEGKDEQELVYFSDEELPQGVGVVFDVSGSMSPNALEFARGALVRFMRQAHASNEYFIHGFDSALHPLTNWTRYDAPVVEGLNKLGHVKSKRTGTVVFDALVAGVEKASRGPRLRRVVILISDGRDTGSRTSFSKLRELVRRSDVLLYAVGIVAPDDPASHSGTAHEARANLEELSGLTGGKAYFPFTEAEIDDTFRRIALELHSQYVLGYKPASADGKWRKFSVKVRPPQGWPTVKVRAREGFYAAPASTNP